jgi:hypothetical protein
MIHPPDKNYDGSSRGNLVMRGPNQTVMYTDISDLANIGNCCSCGLQWETKFTTLEWFRFIQPGVLSALSDQKRTKNKTIKPF